jgi:hypothetical protein
MGNIFLKAETKSANATNSLNRSLLHHDLIEKINYLENKLDNLDNDFYVYREITNANIKIMSADLHQLHQRLIDLKT